MSSTHLKYTALTDDLFEFMVAHSSGTSDELLRQLRIETEQFGEDAQMQTADVQGFFLTILARLLNVQSALEIGTFTGHSSICIARGLPEDGRLICLDTSREWTDVARKYWQLAGVNDKIELHIGDAIESLQRMPDGELFDLVHIDAEKTQYERYYELALPRVRANGLIIFDNMLWGGQIVQADPDERTLAIQQMNHKLVNDPRVETVLLSIGDGVQFCRKK